MAVVFWNLRPSRPRKSPAASPIVFDALELEAGSVNQNGAGKGLSNPQGQTNPTQQPTTSPQVEGFSIFLDR